jgi:hypothetical protein
VKLYGVYGHPFPYAYDGSCDDLVLISYRWSLISFPSMASGQKSARILSTLPPALTLSGV